VAQVMKTEHVLFDTVPDLKRAIEARLDALA
jgi:hypothetical protein